MDYLKIVDEALAKASVPAKEANKAKELAEREPSGFRANAKEANKANLDSVRLARLRAAFDMVMTAFRTHPDEIQLAWTLALRDLDAAEACFHADAAMLKAGWRPLTAQASAFVGRPGSTQRPPGQG